jgi:hypothetical protein
MCFVSPESEIIHQKRIDGSGQKSAYLRKRLMSLYEIGARAMRVSFQFSPGTILSLKYLKVGL